MAWIVLELYQVADGWGRCVRISFPAQMDYRIRGSTTADVVRENEARAGTTVQQTAILKNKNTPH